MFVSKCSSWTVTSRFYNGHYLVEHVDLINWRGIIQYIGHVCIINLKPCSSVPKLHCLQPHHPLKSWALLLISLCLADTGTQTNTRIEKLFKSPIYGPGISCFLEKWSILTLIVSSQILEFTPRHLNFQTTKQFYKDRWSSGPRANRPHWHGVNQLESTKTRD